jgi:DNA-binding NarL/FixJ family response regulator
MTLTATVISDDSAEGQLIAGVLGAADVEVLEEARAAHELESAAEAGPDVIVLSCLAASDAKRGILDLKRRFPEVPVVAIVPDADPSRAVRGALEAHAEGVLFGSRIREALAPTVRAVSAEQIALPRSEYRQARPVVLSYREREVLQLAVDGMTNDAIAKELYISRSTVKSHLTSAFAKLSVRSRSEAAVVLSNPDEPATRLVRGGRLGSGAEAADAAMVRGAA